MKKANSVSYFVHYAIPYCNIDDAPMLYKSYVRLRLEFNTVCWNPRYVREIDCVEKVQRRYKK